MPAIEVITAPRAIGIDKDTIFFIIYTIMHIPLKLKPQYAAFLSHTFA
jgi:hypothetical protein